jgi:hypothetical protein
MWKSLDFKSLVIGGLTALLVVGAMGSWPIGGGSIVLDSAYHGRFTIATQENNAFVLDTATGEVWSQFAGGSQEFFAAKILFAEPNDFDL